MLARVELDDARATAIQLLLIVAWHWTVFPATLAAVDWLLGYGASAGGIAAQPDRFDVGRASEFFIHPLVATSLLTVLLAEGLLSWVTFRVFTRRLRPSFGSFVQSWWRICLWGIVALPLVSVVFADLSRDYDAAMNLPLLWVGCVIVGPTLLFRAESSRFPPSHCRKCGYDLTGNASGRCPECGTTLGSERTRIGRWKPVCPECGYSLRGLRGARCPECGTDFPTKHAGFRRWAFRRFPWDRLPRGSLFSAYLRSLAFIAVLPMKAARGVAVPDRWKRCRRWAVLHLFLATIAAVLLGNDQQYIRWVAHRIWPPTFRPPHLFGFTDPPLDRVLVWAGHSFLAWALVLLLTVTIACAISLCTPGRHRAAKLGGVKWSLYLAPLFLLMLAGWYGFYFILPPQVQAPFPMTFAYKLPPPEIPVWLLVGPYGVWWAIGMAANQYDRKRGCASGIRYGLAFLAMWLLATRVLFAPGPLEALR